MVGSLWLLADGVYEAMLGMDKMEKLDKIDKKIFKCLHFIIVFAVHYPCEYHCVKYFVVYTAKTKV